MMSCLFHVITDFYFQVVSFQNFVLAHFTAITEDFKMLNMRRDETDVPVQDKKVSMTAVFGF